VLGIGTWLMFELFVPEGDIEPQLYGLGAQATTEKSACCRRSENISYTQPRSPAPLPSNPLISART
jgi:hypothetical protein